MKIAVSSTIRMRQRTGSSERSSSLPRAGVAGCPVTRSSIHLAQKGTARREKRAGRGLLASTRAAGPVFRIGTPLSEHAGPFRLRAGAGGRTVQGMGEIELGRTYDAADGHDEHARVAAASGSADTPRVFLVDRLWPRGIKKEALPHDLWLKAIAPSI